MGQETHWVRNHSMSFLQKPQSSDETNHTQPATLELLTRLVSFEHILQEPKDMKITQVGCLTMKEFCLELTVSVSDLVYSKPLSNYTFLT